MVLSASAFSSVPFVVETASFDTERAKPEEAELAVAGIGLGVDFLIDLADRQAHVSALLVALVAHTLGIVIGVGGVGRASLASVGYGVENETWGNAQAAGPVGVGCGIKRAGPAQVVMNSAAGSADALFAVEFFVVSAPRDTDSGRLMESEDAFASA